MHDFVAFPVERVEYGSDRNSQRSQNLDRFAWGGDLVNPRATHSVSGVHFENVTVGGNLTISGVTINLPRELPPLWVNVPSLPNHFLGRDALVDDLVARLIAGHSPALSAEGLPGVGKTTLAVVLAHHPDILAHFSDGVLWAGLGPTPDVPSQLAAWANALGIDVSDRPTSKARAQAVRNEIGQRRLLLVIDDAWQTDGADLLRCGGPGCSHLLTTRDQAIARRFAGVVQSVSVSTLADDPAFDLLQTLAPEACAADPEAARALARTVDGLPLALALLGGYLAAPERSYFAELSAAALDELADPGRRLALASKRLGSSDDAQVTLRETVALSLEGLPEEVVTAFHALGAFAPKPATFSLEAAEAVTEVGAATLALLVARNLLERGEAERLTLHQVLSDVARTKLEQRVHPIGLRAQFRKILGSVARTRLSPVIKRHRDYYLALIGKNQNDWQQIGLIYSQVQRSLSWQVTMQPDGKRLFDFHLFLGAYQVRQGLWSDYEDLATKCLELAQRKGDRARQAWLLNGIGYMHSALGEKRTALMYYEKSLLLHRRVGDRSGKAAILNNIGCAYDDLGEKENALDYYEQAIHLYHKARDRLGEATTLNNIGIVYQFLGENENALECFEQASLLLHQMGRRSVEATVLSNIGSVYDALGEKGRALEYFEQALPLGRLAGNRSGEATTLNNIGLVYAALGEKRKALDYFEQALLVSQQVRYRSGEATTLRNIGCVYYNLGENERALEYYEQALSLGRLAEDRSGKATTLNNIGAVYDTLGEKEKALMYYEEALPLQRQVRNRSGEAMTLNNIGRVHDVLGEKQEALRYYEQALPLFRQVGDRSGEAVTLNNMAMIYIQQGQPERTVDMLAGAVQTLRGIGAVAEEAAGLFNLAFMLGHYLGRLEEAIEHLTRSIDILHRYNLPQDAAGQTLAQHEAFLAQLTGEQR